MNQLKEMLEAYRNGERGLPTYSELQSFVDASEKPKTIQSREFQELAMAYRLGSIFSNASSEYNALVNYIDGKLK